MAEVKSCPALVAAKGDRVTLFIHAPVYSEPGASEAVPTPMGSMRVDPNKLRKESTFLAWIFSRKSLDQGKDSFDIQATRMRDIEPIMEVISWAEESSNAEIAKAVQTSTQDKLFDRYVCSGRFSLDRVSQILGAELESRITKQLCHTFLEMSDDNDFTRGWGTGMVRRATNMFFESFDPSRGFAHFKFEHVLALVKWENVPVHPNCLFGFVIDWLKTSPDLSSERRRKLIEAMPFTDMCPLFLSNVVKNNKILSQCVDIDDNEACAVLLKSRLVSAFEDIACGRISTRRLEHGNKDQVHPIVINSKFKGLQLSMESLGCGCWSPKNVISEVVCVDGYFMHVELAKASGGNVKVLLCLDEKETRLGSNFQVTFVASMREVNSGKSWNSGEAHCSFTRDETQHTIDVLALFDSRRLDVNTDLAVTVRRIRQSVKI